MAKPTGRRVSAVTAARRGRRVLELAATGMSPTDISKKAKLHRVHVHRILADWLKQHRDRQMVGRLREGA